MSRPNHSLIDDVEQAIADRAIAERRLSDAIARLRETASTLGEIEDVGLRLQLASYLYWNVPEVSSLVLAQAITGLPGKKGVFAFLKLLPRRSTQFYCDYGQHYVQARSREELTLLAKHYGSVSATIRCCNQCDEARRASAIVIDMPETNDPVSERERHGIEEHIAGRGALTVNVRHIFGGVDVVMGPALLEQYLVDPDGAAAKALGVPKHEYLEWLASWGSVECSGTTLKGKPCKLFATGLTALDLEAWRKAREVRGYCHAHGG